MNAVETFDLMLSVFTQVCLTIALVKSEWFA
jgi:hypothetical protein